MEQQNKGISLDEFIFRKLQPVRILVGYLNNEYALTEGETVTMDRNDYEAIISTLEIFVEEYDRVSQHRATARKPGKKFSNVANVESKANIKAIA